MGGGGIWRRDRADDVSCEDRWSNSGLTDLFAKLRLGAFVVFWASLRRRRRWRCGFRRWYRNCPHPGPARWRGSKSAMSARSRCRSKPRSPVLIFDDGKLVETPGDDDFITFPPQGLVPVSGRQVVRVQWIGRPDIPTSQAYYLWVRQLPVETNPQKIQGTDASVSIDILYTMKSLIVVAPPGAKPDVEVESPVPEMITLPAPEPVAQAEGADPVEAKAPEPQPGLKVVVINKGNRYALMSGAKWVVTRNRYRRPAFRADLWQRRSVAARRRRISCSSGRQTDFSDSPPASHLIPPSRFR